VGYSQRMQPLVPHWVDVLLTGATWGLAPVVALGISVLYYVASPVTVPMSMRILTSAHGAAITAIYLTAMAVAVSGHSNPRYGTAFSLALAIPVLLMLISLVMFKGKKGVHLLLVINIVCLLWSGLLGAMAVTGDWM
jgi:hypothetical protein